MSTPVPPLIVPPPACHTLSSAGAAAALYLWIQESVS